ncbi:MAG: hypothetical protein ACE5OW_01390 [Candidatus Bathyarchaeia archaeon]
MPLILKEVPEANLIVVGGEHAHERQGYAKTLVDIILNMGLDDQIFFKGCPTGDSKLRGEYTSQHETARRHEKQKGEFAEGILLVRVDEKIAESF